MVKFEQTITTIETLIRFESLDPEMKLYVFMFHNWRGAIGLALAASLAWVIVFELLNGRDRDFLWTWMFLSSTWAATTDRLKSAEILKSYFYYVEVSMCPELQDHVDRRTRISVFGIPLVKYPVLALICGLVFPLIEKAPLPPLDFYRDGLICAVGSALVYLMTQPLRELPEAKA